jgi:hypothetical protein
LFDLRFCARAFSCASLSRSKSSSRNPGFNNCDMTMPRNGRQVYLGITAVNVVISLSVRFVNDPVIGYMAASS